MNTTERRFSSVEFTASVSHESRLLTDPYILVWTKEGLHSPNHKCLVKDLIERNTTKGSADGQAFDYLEKVVGRESSGTVFWFSPALSSTESPKMIATQIYTARNGAKITYNYAVLFRLSNEEFLETANRLAQYAGEEAENSMLGRRSKPIFLRETSVHWTYFTGEVLPDKEWRKIRQGDVWITKRQTLRGVCEFYKGRINPHLFGDNPLSCPTAFDTMFNLGDKVICPNCKRDVNVKEGAICGGCGKTRPKVCG